MARLHEFVIRRALQMIPLLILITLFSFTLMRMAPGDPLAYMFGSETGSPEEKILRDLYIKKWGLDKPVWEQYAYWLGNSLRGDLGFSFLTGRPVADMVAERIPFTLELALSSLFLALVLSIPLGVLSAVKQNSPMDRATTSLSVVANSMPPFWVGILMIIVFAVYLGWFPTSGAGMGQGLYQNLLALIMPMIVLGLSRIGLLTRITRNSVLDVLHEDYIRTARAKGLKEYVVVYRHALRNALLPVVTLLGLELAFLFSGAVLVETVFAWPGMGQFFVITANRRDYPTLMGVQLVVSITILVAMLITDITYALLDPRIKY